MKLSSTLTKLRILRSVRTLAKITAFATLAALPLHIPSAFAETDKTVEFSQGELDQMLAPIALYPDTILSQVLIASTYPLEVIQADRWARANSSVKGADAVKLVENKDWDPSVKALVAFPDILQKMSEDIDWTQRLGDAFLGSEEQVMDTVQKLRKRAYASGSLDKVQHLKVAQEENQIVIEPAEERVVYVPVYDTRVVYGNWWWPDYPPVYWHYPASYTYVSGFYWGPRIYIGPTFFYSSCHWSHRRVVVVDYHNHYYNEPRFYTSRSIITYQGSREWHHDPVHRRGVAYYNDNLRNSYGSRHESYRDDRNYREQYRSNYTPTQPHRVDNDASTRVIQSQNHDARFDNNSGNQPFDRAELLRGRMNQRATVDVNNQTSVNPGRESDRRSHNDNGQQFDRNVNHFNRQDTGRADVGRNDTNVITRSDNVNNDARMAAERERARYPHAQNMETNPQYNPHIEQRTEQRPEPRIEQHNDNRPMRVDDSMTRRVEPQRSERGGENRTVRGRGRDDDKKE